MWGEIKKQRLFVALAGAVGVDNVDRATGKYVGVVGAIDPFKAGYRLVACVVEREIHGEEANGVVVAIAGEVVPVVLQTGGIVALPTTTKKTRCRDLTWPSFNFQSYNTNGL